jgi:hypothetical protein
MQQAHARHYESGLRHYESGGVIVRASPPKTKKKKKKKTWQQKHNPLALIVIGNPTHLFVRPFVCLFVCLLFSSTNKNFTGRPGGWVSEWAKGLLTLTS